MLLLTRRRTVRFAFISLFLLALPWDPQSVDAWTTHRQQITKPQHRSQKEAFRFQNHKHTSPLQVINGHDSNESEEMKSKPLRGLLTLVIRKMKTVLSTLVLIAALSIGFTPKVNAASKASGIGSAQKSDSKSKKQIQLKRKNEMKTAIEEAKKKTPQALKAVEEERKKRLAITQQQQKAKQPAHQGKTKKEGSKAIISSTKGKSIRLIEKKIVDRAEEVGESVHESKKRRLDIIGLVLVGASSIYTLLSGKEKKEELRKLKDLIREGVDNDDEDWDDNGNPVKFELEGDYEISHEERVAKYKKYEKIVQGKLVFNPKTLAWDDAQPRAPQVEKESFAVSVEKGPVRTSTNPATIPVSVSSGKTGELPSFTAKVPIRQKIGSSEVFNTHIPGSHPVVTELDRIDINSTNTIQKKTDIKQPIEMKGRMAFEPAADDEDVADDPLENDLPFASVMKVPVSPRVSNSSNASPAAVVPSAVIPVPEEPKKGVSGFLGSLFSKAGGSRAAELKDALNVKNKSRTFRIEVANVLGRYIPDGVEIKGWDAFSGDMSEELAQSSTEEAAEALVRIYQSNGLSVQEAAESFADVTSAYLTQLIDVAVETVDNQDEMISVQALDNVAEFMDNIGAIFLAVTPGIKVEPIKYSGKAKRSKLETLYTRYARAAADIKALFAGNQESSDSDENGQTGIQKTREERLGRIQFLFDIKEAKRAQVQQKIVMDSISSLVGDVGSAENIQEVLQQSISQGGYGALNDAIPDLGEFPHSENLDPAQFDDYTKNAMEQVRDGLRSGTFSKSDVLEFERLMGADLEMMLKALSDPKLDKRPLQKLGGSLDELLEMFKQLATIKKQK